MSSPSSVLRRIHRDAGVLTVKGIPQSAVSNGGFLRNLRNMTSQLLQTTHSYRNSKDKWISNSFKVW
ncbi:hypothetical protein CEXT_380681 [Caerostris extrusa]|uniref:Uncharacterized protein n=1 Tax=Caerostris extrusa TaxID=172846 RepID=A0AAV4TLQ7_CAEEX|nr:hypothetical protein CEXT_380681 [Caerostris extrusa]